jgi:hypothetical protein
MALTQQRTAESDAMAFDAIEWALRLGVGLVYVGIGCEKVFPSRDSQTPNEASPSTSKPRWRERDPGGGVFESTEAPTFWSRTSPNRSSYWR